MNFLRFKPSGSFFRAACWLAASILLIAFTAHALPGDGNIIGSDFFNFNTYSPFPEKPFDALSNGEKIDLYTGGLSVSKTDLSIPGRMNANLEVGRVFATDPQLLNEFEVVQSDNFALALTQKDERESIVLDPFVSMGKIVYETSLSKLKNRIYWYPSASDGMQLRWGDYAGIILITFTFPYVVKEPGQPLYGDRVAYLVRNDGTLEQFDYAGSDVTPNRRSNGMMRYYIGKNQITNKPEGMCQLNNPYPTIDSNCEKREEGHISWSNDSIDGIEYVEASGRINFFKPQKYGGIFHSSFIPIDVVYCEDGVRECIVNDPENKAIKERVSIYRIDVFQLNEVTDSFGNKREYTYSHDGNSVDIKETLGNASRHVKIYECAGADKLCVCGPTWGENSTPVQSACDSYDRDIAGRIVRYVNRVGEEMNFAYEPSSQSLPFPTPLRFASSLKPEPADRPSSFLQLKYPTGGVLRYEQYGASPNVENDQGRMSRTALVTLWPNANNSDQFLQKEIVVDPTWESSGDMDRLTVSYDIDGRETSYLFTQLNDVPVLRRRLVRTAAMPSFSLDASCDDPSCVQEDFKYSYGKDLINGTTRSFVRGVTTHALRYGGADFITTTEYVHFNPVAVSEPDGALTQFLYLDVLPLTYYSQFAEAEVTVNISDPSYVIKKDEHFVTVNADNKTRTTSFNWGGIDGCGKVLPSVVLNSSSVADDDKSFLQSYCYDGSGNINKLTKSYSEGGASKAIQEADIVYDGMGLYPASKTVNGNNWQYAYDIFGRIVRETGPNNGATSYVYDDAGRIRRVVYGVNGSFKEYKYNVAGSEGKPFVTITSFDQVRAKKTVDTLSYDGLGRPVTSNINGITTNFNYDDRGFLHSIEEGESSREYHYDALGRMSHVNSSDTGLMSFSYDVVDAGWIPGQPAHAIRRAAFIGGNDVRNRYFAIDGKLLRDERIDDNGLMLALNYAYDEIGNLIRKMSPSGRTSTWVYDGLSRLVSSSLSTGAKTSVSSWSPTGMPKSTLLSDGQQNTYTYEGGYGRMDKATYGVSGGAQYVLSFEYDASDSERNGLGRLASVSDANGNITNYSYDPGGTQAFLKRTLADLNSTYAVGMIKDTKGRTYRLNYPDGRAVYYLTDSTGRIDEIRLNSIDGPNVASFSYDARNRLSRIEYGNGVITTYGYVGDLLVEILISKESKELYHVEYAYDNRGRRIEAVHHDSSRTTYDYDNADRLTVASYYHSGEDQPYNEQRYAYDSDGNRISYSDKFKKITYIYDSNRPLLLEANYNDDDGWHYNYDGFGRLVERKHVQAGRSLEWQSFVWDGASRLIRVEVRGAEGAAASKHEYSYDNNGRREKISSSDTSKYAIYGESLDPLTELDAEGESIQDFVYIGEHRIAALDDERVDFFSVDEIGSTLLTMDEQGNVTSGYRYDPFGNVNFSIANNENNYRFAGKRYDSETGFVYFGGRYYDPLVGRFISPDPLDEGTNPYVYASNNPFGSRDIFGWYLVKAKMWGGDAGKSGGGSVVLPYPSDEGDGGGDEGGCAGDGCGEGQDQRGGDTGQGNGGSSNNTNDHDDDSSKPSRPPYRTYDMPVAVFSPTYDGLYDLVNFANVPAEDMHWDQAGMNGSIISSLPSLGSDRLDEENGDGTSIAGAPANNDPGSASDSWADNDPAKGTSFEKYDVVEQVFVGGRTADMEVSGDRTQSVDTANRQVQERAGSKTPDSRTTDGDPITLHNAEVLNVERALKIPGRGMDFEFVRTYRSRIEYDGPIGYNWDHNYNKRLLKIDRAYCEANPLDTCCAEVKWNEKPEDYIACYIRFDGNARFDAYEYDEAGNYFRAPLGYFDRLVRHDDGTVTIRDNHGVTNYYAPDGFCTAIEDRFGNRMRLEYEGSGKDRHLVRVIDTLDRTISLRYSGKHLVEVEDFTGRKLRFGYDITNNLTSFTEPATAAFPNGTTTTYAYSSGYPLDKEMLNHNLISVTDSLGQKYVEFAYSFSDRLVWHRFGDGIFTIQSTMMGAWPACETQEEVNRVASRTRIIDRNGNERLHEFNCQGNALAIHQYTRGLRQGDPAEFVTRYSYDLNGLTTSATKPAGNKIEVAYQQMQSGDSTVDRLFAANPVLIRRVPDAARGGSVVETSFTYEPLAMQPLTETKAGLTRTMWYDYQEGATTAQLAAEMGVSEAVAAAIFADVPLAQGDLNADGVVNDMRGNAVRVDEPLVHDLHGNEQVVRRLMRSNEHGQLISEIDPVGTETAYSYYALGNQRGLLESKTVDPAGLALRTTYEYDSVGNPIKITDASGAVAHNTFDQLGRVIETADAAGAITRNTYDAEGNLVRADRPGSVDAGDLWITTKTSYNMLNRPILREDETTPDNYVITEFRFDPGERLTRVIKPLGNSTVTDYDERDLVMRVRRGSGSEAESIETRRYDANGNLAEKTDGAGGVTQYKYDGHDRLVQVVDPAGAAALTQYDAFDRPVAVSKYGEPDPGGDPQTLISHQGFIYDELGRRLAVRDYSVSNGVAGTYHQASSAYDAAGRVVSETDALGNSVIHEYDAAGRLARSIDAAGNEVLTSYDGMGRPIEVKRRELDESSGQTHEYVERFAYDGMGRVVSHEDPLGHIERKAYDGRGNLIWQADAKGALGLDSGGDAGPGNVQRNSFDGLNRLVKFTQELRTDGSGGGTLGGTIQTSYAWDDNGNLAAITDANGNATSYEYDAQDRRIATELPDGATYRVEYDGASRPAREIDPRGIVVRKIYDPAGRVTLRTVSKNGATLRRDDFSYDGLSRMRMAISRDGSGVAFSTIEEGFDSFGRNDLSKQDGIAVTRTFDTAGRVLSVAGQNGATAVYQRDGIGRISSVAEASLGILAKPEYAGLHRYAKVTLGNGLALSESYDAAARPASTQVEDASHNIISGYEVGYDRAGQKLYEKRLHDQGKGELYQYDSVDRLIAASQGVPSVEQHIGEAMPGAFSKHVTYAIDPVHNWISRVEYRDPANTALNVARTYVPNSLNQYISMNKGIDGGAPVNTSFTYDEAGNLIDDGKYRYSYDDRNMVTEVRDSLNDTFVAAYAYDALKRRISELRADGTVTQFVYDNWQEIEEITDGTLTASYIYDDGIDHPIAMISNNHAYYYHADTRNNIAAITDENGALVERYSYDPYGEATITDDSGNTVTTSTIGNEYRFSSRRYDAATGLYYYRNRMYSPELGRFLQRDPVGYADSMNVYAYVGNNPVLWADPYGLDKNTASPIVHLNRERSATYLEALSDAIANHDVQKAYDIGKQLAREANADVRISAAGSFHGEGVGWSITLSISHSGDVTISPGVGLGVGAGVSVSVGGSSDPVSPPYVPYVQGALAGGSGGWGGDAVLMIGVDRVGFSGSLGRGYAFGAAATISADIPFGSAW